MEKSKMIKINKDGAILDISKISYITKERDLYGGFNIKFILNLQSETYEVIKEYDSMESREQWFSKITKELLGEQKWFR